MVTKIYFVCICSNKEITSRQSNSDIILRKAREYYEKNKEKRKEYYEKKYRKKKRI